MVAIQLYSTNAKKGKNTMRILNAILLTLVLVSSLWARALIQTSTIDSRIAVPADVKVYELNGSARTALDSIGPDSAVIYGPINLSAGPQDPMYNAFMVRFTAGLADAGDSITVQYQVLHGTTLADTVASGWIALDTVINAGEDGPWTSLASTAGKALAIRVYGEDSTLSILSGKLLLIMKRLAAWNTIR